MREKSRQAREHHNKTKEDTYCGKFLVRGSSKSSPLDKIILSSSGQTREAKKPGVRYLSAWRHLQRFYELTKNQKPIAFVRRRCQAFFTDAWIAVYPCNFYVYIGKSPDGLRGNHPVVLYYAYGRGENYAIASSCYSEHFTQRADTAIPEFIRHLRITKGFFQTEIGQKQQIPL